MPVAGPVPPPIIVVMPAASASSICCGQMKWMWLSMPPAVTIMPSPAITSVPGPMTIVNAWLDVGIAGLADSRNAPILEADVSLHDAPVVEDQRVGDDRVDGFAARPLRLAHAVANDLAATELHFVAVDREVALDFDDELGVRKPDPVPGRGTEHLGVSAARDLHASFRLTPGATSR